MKLTPKAYSLIYGNNELFDRENKLRQLVINWRNMISDYGEDMYGCGSDDAYTTCADDLEAVLGEEE